jgi:tetratricopeptide (TPR) repeat protein
LNSFQNEEDIKTLRLLFEFSPESSLFARIAEQEIIDGNYQKSLELLTKGIERYPNYPSARIMLAKTYAYLNEREKAFNEIEMLKSLIYEEETIKHYRIEIEKILSGKSETVKDENNDTDLENDSPDWGGTEIVSETLAGIYRAQGSLDEAIIMYRLLLKKHPEKKEHYEQILAELEIEKNNED